MCRFVEIYSFNLIGWILSLSTITTYMTSKQHHSYFRTVKEISRAVIRYIQISKDVSQYLRSSHKSFLSSITIMKWTGKPDERNFQNVRQNVHVHALFSTATFYRLFINLQFIRDRGWVFINSHFNINIVHV